MINPIYGVNCLKLGFERYKRYCKWQLYTFRHI